MGRLPPMPDISIVKTKEDAGSKSLQVTVPVDRVRAAEHKALRYFSQRARLPGFRPGKAPEAVVRRRFGEQIRQTVLDELTRESWRAVKVIFEPFHAWRREMPPEPFDKPGDGLGLVAGRLERLVQLVRAVGKPDDHAASRGWP